jgi:hypothetical protein
MPEARGKSMKPNNEISPGLLDNPEFFDSEFFNRFGLRPAPGPLQLTASIEKLYQFPAFYADVTCAMAIFFCSYQRAKEMLPHPGMEPVRMGRNRALVVFSCYEYRHVMGISPYNEIAMTIPVLINPVVNIPVLPMILPGFKNFGYYCYSMPVTSLENKIRGHEFWGLPKVVEEISITIKDNICRAQAIDHQQNSYFELRVPIEGKKKHFDVSSYLYSIKNQDLRQSKTCFQGNFTLIKFMDVLFKKGKKPDLEYLRIGPGPSGQVLKNLEIEAHPFQLRFCLGMNSCFDLPVGTSQQIGLTQPGQHNRRNV